MRGCGSEVVFVGGVERVFGGVCSDMCDCGVVRWRCQCEVIRKLSDSDRPAAGGEGQG